MSNKRDTTETAVAKRVLMIVGMLEGDLGDFIVGQGPPARGEAGAWHLVKDALTVAEMLTALQGSWNIDEDTRQEAALLIQRLLMAATSARDMAQEGGNHG